MPNPAKLYQREMYKNLGFFANWLPGDPIELGAIGVLSDGRFQQVTSLKELGIECPERAVGNRQDLSYTSSSGVQINSHASMAVPAAQAGLAINFSDEGAFLFQAIGVRQRQLSERTRMAHGVLKLDDQKKWSRDWVIVEALHVADSATVIVSETRGSGVTLHAANGGPVAMDALGDASAGLRVTGSVGKVLTVLCASKLRPLYKCTWMTRGWLPGSKRQLNTRSLPFDEPPLEQLLGD